jgi:hypothetical protein
MLSCSVGLLPALFGEEEERGKDEVGRSSWREMRDDEDDGGEVLRSTKVLLCVASLSKVVAERESDDGGRKSDFREDEEDLISHLSLISQDVQDGIEQRVRTETRPLDAKRS